MGGAILIVSKNWPLFVWRLSVFGGFGPFEKLGLPPKKKIGGKTWAGPPTSLYGYWVQEVLQLPQEH